MTGKCTYDVNTGSKTKIGQLEPENDTIAMEEEEESWWMSRASAQYLYVLWWVATICSCGAESSTNKTGRFRDGNTEEATTVGLCRLSRQGALSHTEMAGPLFNKILPCGMYSD